MVNQDRSATEKDGLKWSYERMHLPLELMDRVDDVAMVVHFRDACRAQERFLDAWDRWQVSLPLDRLTKEEQHAAKNAACTCYEDVLWA